MSSKLYSSARARGLGCVAALSTREFRHFLSMMH